MAVQTATNHSVAQRLQTLAQLHSRGQASELMEQTLRKLFFVRGRR